MSKSSDSGTMTMEERARQLLAHAAEHLDGQFHEQKLAASIGWPVGRVRSTLKWCAAQGYVEPPDDSADATALFSYALSHGIAHGTWKRAAEVLPPSVLARTSTPDCSEEFHEFLGSGLIEARESPAGGLEVRLTDLGREAAKAAR